jgi:SAM-dependent methyltransferase
VQEIAPRTTAALERIFAAMDLPVRAALDLGAGTGAAGDAVRARFGSQVAVVGIDRVPAPGLLTADLSRQEALHALLGGRLFELIVAAHLLNELGLSIEATAKLVTAWGRHLAPGGRIVIVEPALHATSRDLLQVRDVLLGCQGSPAAFFVQAPCLWQKACPALARERDWCHDAAPVPKDARLRVRRVDFSYLVLGRAQDGAAPAPAPDRFRVVSDVRREKGRTRLWGCGPGGRHDLVLQTRDETPLNAAFCAADRGGLVRISGTRSAGDGLRLGPESTVENLPPHTD